jgi:hypothetical protein
MAQLLNYTPHPIHILDGDNKIIRTIQSSGLIRLKASTVDAGTIEVKTPDLWSDNTIVGEKTVLINITKTVFGEPEGLPDMQIRAFAWGVIGTHEFYPSKEKALVALNDEEDVRNRNGVDEATFEIKTYYIVSQLVKSALPNRCDLLVPAEVQRDEKGNIIGCRSLGI